MIQHVRNVRMQNLYLLQVITTILHLNIVGPHYNPALTPLVVVFSIITLLRALIVRYTIIILLLHYYYTIITLLQVMVEARSPLLYLSIHTVPLSKTYRRRFECFHPNLDVRYISLIADGPHHYHPACGH